MQATGMAGARSEGAAEAEPCAARAVSLRHVYNRVGTTRAADYRTELVLARARRRPVAALVAACCLALPCPSLRAASDAASVIQARVGQLLNGAPVPIGSAVLASSVVLPAFYEHRGFEPAWTEAGNLDALLAALHDSAQDGLIPQDYHLDALQALRAAAPGAERDADLDLLATDALVRLGYHLRVGKVDPARPDASWNLRRDHETALQSSPALALDRVLAERRVAQAIGMLRPAHPVYAALRAALQRYRAIEADGGWRMIPAGRTLKPGASDPRVPALRARLLAEGDLAPSGAARDEAAEAYDADLEAAVQRFQARHGLAPDGLVGPRTRQALNVPVRARIDQLRLSLERARQIMHDLPERFVVVNVPGFRVHYVEGGEVRFSSKVVVGKPVAETPIFRAQMTHAVINPSWTVPPLIVRTEIVPALKQDPDYLARKGLVRVGGQVVQPPGPDNALGRIKLMFPNPYHVYLHDTPQRELFERDGRAFSHGCVRVENIFDLAALAIGDPQHWSKEKLLEAADSGETLTVVLQRRLPVLLAYWTAGVAADGSVTFYEDVYGRDAAALRALDAPFASAPASAAAGARGGSAPR
jgi:murein L,D-transpeptidase YcbB/YkuD